MASLTPAEKAGIAAATLLSLAGVAAGIIIPRVTGVATDANGQPCATSIEIPFTTAPTSPVACKRVEVAGPSAAWSALPGLCPGHSAVAIACGEAMEGEEAALPAGIRTITEPEAVAYPGDGVQLRLWMDRDPAFAAHLDCACGPADPARVCTALEAEGSRPARVGEYLPPGTFQGDCPRRPCWESAESVATHGVGYSMPSSCRN